LTAITDDESDITPAGRIRYLRVLLIAIDPKLPLKQNS